MKPQRTPDSAKVPTDGGAKEHLSRTARRRLVLGANGGYLAVVGFWVLSRQLEAPWLMLLVAVAGLVSVYSYARLLYTGGFLSLANDPDTKLDERQIRARDGAYRRAYTVSTTAVFLLMVYWYVAADAADSGRIALWLPQTFAERSAVLWGVLLLLNTLPAVVLAWLEPDPNQDEVTFAGEPS